MRIHRQAFQVPGEPSKVASRAALRLAHLGDQVEPLGDAQFVWRPQPAERKLFRCPEAVRVTALTAEQPGRTLLVLEWRGDLGLRWLRPVGFLLAAIGLATALLAPSGTTAGHLVFGLWPAVMALLAPKMMESDWLARLRHSAEIGVTPPLERVPASQEWLMLPESERAEVLAGVEAQADRLAAENRLFQMGKDVRSAETRLGWPVSHTAFGRDSITGRTRVARGWKAKGQVALGRVAIGQYARGWLAIGQAAIGLVAIGQLALGALVGVGQAVLAAIAAAGQVAAALAAVGQIAFGLFAVGAHGDLLDFALWVFLLCFVAIALLMVLLGRPAKQRGEDAIAARVGEWEEAPVAGEASLSPARMRGEGDPERGISPVTIER